ncbi:winged helix-turn-helix domain-containing protein, partial [Enterobacter hormaechei]|uniref:winged helix-turn-helix domain-containing protein n=1 Tax=Enterobacter hormaechei TaxID=158836 RepID=UPI0014836ADD
STGLFSLRASDGVFQTYRLGSKECAILELLSHNKETIVSRDEILQHVWKERFVCENVVSVALSNIRKIIRKVDEDCLCLSTISGKGYIFTPHKSGLYCEPQE